MDEIVLNDSEDVVHTIVSTWRQQCASRSKENSTQSDPLVLKSADTQTELPETVEVQTDEMANYLSDVQAKLALNSLVSASSLMEEQLSQNRTSHAFDDYDVQWDEERNTITKLYTLRDAAFEKQQLQLSSSTASSVSSSSSSSSLSNKALYSAIKTSSNLSSFYANQHYVDDSSPSSNVSTTSNNESDSAPGCSSLTWNNIGTRLAVGFGRQNHFGWCDHSSRLVVYSRFSPSSSSSSSLHGHLVSFSSSSSSSVSSSSSSSSSLSYHSLVSSFQKHIEFVLDIPCCVTSLSFHPEKPSILAVGLFNGEIHIYDLNRDADSLLDSASFSSFSSSSSFQDKDKDKDKDKDMHVMNSTIDDFFHHEPISKLCWVRDISAKGGGLEKGERVYELVSVSGDGKVLFWSLLNQLSHPYHGVILTPSKKYQGHGTSRSNALLGGTSLSFSIDNVNYIIGTQGGGIIRSFQPVRSLRRVGTMYKVGEFHWTADAYQLLDLSPEKSEVRRHVEKYVRLKGIKQIDCLTIFDARPDLRKLYPPATKFAYDAHAGPIFSVAFSPFHRNIFLSCSSDGTVRLFNALQSKPLLHFELSNITSQTLSIASSSSCPTVLDSNSLSPSSSFSFSSSSSTCYSSSLYASSKGSMLAGYLLDVVWSTSRPLVFAVCDVSGRIHLFDLKESVLAPVLSIQANTEQMPVTAITFNQKDPSLLSSCDLLGNVIVWQLSSRLSTLQVGETVILEKMGRVSPEEE
eukprot:TRINITY_DN521_c1_g1_i1.p1 TRINITY_DN521_c1_g1~~TRINITY_DN521_c1_g1_i1.p1  ORF type:complete len:744 (-),score=199.84 TRINITY_DN521_c1_g1_i1:729-2960(-)